LAKLAGRQPLLRQSSLSGSQDARDHLRRDAEYLCYLSLAIIASAPKPSRCDTFIAVVWASKLGDLNNPPGTADLPGKRALLVQPEVSVVPANPDHIDRLGVVAYYSIAVRALVHGANRLTFRLVAGCAALQLEILALRHQLGVLQRSVKRSKLTPADRLLWAWLCRVWQDWQSGVFIIKAATVLGWHRKGFCLFWRWKIRHGKPGRPAVPEEIRELIRMMSRENPLWDAPRIYGELLKLGIQIGETSVSKYMVRRRRPPSQTWKTLLENYVKSIRFHDMH
jgi:hypothetical protein